MESQLVCVSGPYFFLAREGPLPFWVLKSHWKSSAAQLWVDVPAHGYWCWGLVVFAEVKVPVRSGRKCGLRMYAALCVAAREGASLW